MLKAIPNAPGFVPTLVGAVLLGLLLLFFRDLGDQLRQYLVPSLVVYVLGTGLIGYIHLMLWLRVDEDPKRLPMRKVTYVWVVQIAWFFFFLVYNFIRRVL